MSSLLNYLFSSTKQIEQSTTQKIGQTTSQSISQTTSQSIGQQIDIVKTITLTAQDDYQSKSLDLPDNFVGSIYVKSEDYGSACFSYVPNASVSRINSVKGTLYSTRPTIEGSNGYLTFHGIKDNNILDKNDITYTVRIVGI